MGKHVWEFTNQRKLTASEFVDYFERKIFRTIRKYSMLPKNKIITLKKSNSLNTNVLKEILEKKFKVRFSTSPNFSSDNLSAVAEGIFKDVIKGKFEKVTPDIGLKKPLYFLSDKEVGLYAELKRIKGVKRKVNKKIRKFFEKFLDKNQDLEINIVKAAGQIKD